MMFKFKYRFTALLLLFWVVCTQAAVNTPVTMKTYKFADRDTCSLYMDVYTPAGAPANNKAIIYVFGGGFVQGSRNSADNVAFYDSMLQRGYTVVAIDYRLGLKGVSRVSALNPGPPFRAVALAVEDLVSATRYIIDNRATLMIDPTEIVLIGSSAGAITVLETDYLLANQHKLTASLPTDFRYAGVVSLAGSVFSTQGKPKYKTTPAPTLFMHGTADKVVNYKQIKLLRLGTFGSKPLIEIFTKNGYPYMAYRFEGSSHEVAEFPRTYCLDQIDYFLRELVDKRRNFQFDITVRDPYVREHFKIEITSRKDLYK